MTKEEIIDNLKYQNKKHYGGQSRTLFEAIKLIEQQPSEDCVSRAEVLKAINEDLEIKIEGRKGLEIYQNEVCEIIKNLITNQETKVKSLPPVTPTFPKGATNGGMIKAMFPDIKIHEHEKTDICDAYIQIDIWDFSICVSKDWWDAPYKRGDSDGSN